MDTLRLMIRHTPGRVWVIVLLASGFVATIVALLPYEAALDICDPTHESPNTPFAWGVAAVSILMPLAISALSKRPKLIIIAVLVAALEVVVWTWALTGPGSCG